MGKYILECKPDKIFNLVDGETVVAQNMGDGYIIIEQGATYRLDVEDENAPTVCLNDVRLEKKIYEPGCLTFTIQGINLGLSGYVTLFYDEDIVAKKYYIFEKISKGEYVTYKAYSVDKFLTIEKFNYAHTGKRLVDVLFKKDEYGNIVDEDNNVVITNLGEKKGGTPKALASGIVFSLLDAPQKGSALKKFKELVLKKNNNYYVKNLNHLGTGDEEAILPYCVQYQESFFDFMVRICNRYGEFLYCENNEWHIGRAGIKNGNGTEIIASLTDKYVQSEEKYESCIEIEETSNLEVSNYLKEEYVNNIMERDKTNPVVNNAGMLSEEYFESINNDDYAHYSDYLPPLSTAFDMLKSAEERQNFFDAVASTLVASSVKFSVTGVFMSATNKKYSDYYGTLTDKENEGKKHEFTRTPNKVDATFYAKILKGEEYAEKNKLMLEFSTYRHLLLGQRVEYGGTDYVVYSVNGGITDNKTESQTVTLVPVQADEKIYPLPLYDKHIRKASPQRAVVVFNFDPERLGRVRVKYPWQTIGTAKEELKELNDEQIEKKKKQNKFADATPWLRVSYPMASKESGFMFFPKEGDEVLIDYEDGNIDRPFVAGSFYNETNRPSVPSSTHLVGLTKSITSDNGHHISFTDLSGDKFVNDLIPGLSLLSKFGIEAIPLSKITDKAKYLGGGFEIADYLGVYSIKGSTNGRNITISSPVGDVVVDAFSGITIKAPHGDVNIVGKNVNIEARNNLTIQSGTNIKRPYFFHYNRMGAVGAVSSFAAATTASVIKAVGLDLSFHRTWLEVLLRPIGGTMQIKSYRFMHLEAGNGEAKFARNRESAGFWDKLWTGMVFRHAFRDNPLYSSENPNKFMEDYKYCMLVMNKVNRLIYEVIEDLNNELQLLTIQKNKGDFPEEKFKMYIEDWMNLTDGKGVYEKKGHVESRFQAIYVNRKLLELKLKPLNSDLLKELDKNITKNLKSIKDELKKIDYDARLLWYIDPILIDDVVVSFKKGMFQIVKKYLKDNDLKDLIKMDSTKLNDDDWNNADSPNWDKAIKVVETPDLKKLAEEHPIGTMAISAWKGAKRAANKLGFNGFMDDDVWGKNERSKILFSDKEGVTYYLTNDGVKTENPIGLTAVVDEIRNQIKNFTLS